MGIGEYMESRDGISIVGITEIAKEQSERQDEVTTANTQEAEGTPDLRSHILHTFQDNKDARESGGVNKLMLDSLRDYNGTYSTEELGRIKKEGASEIFMNLPSTKVRAAISWIKDILLAGKVDASGKKISSPDHADALAYTFFDSTISMTRRKSKARPVVNRPWV
jgi:hypothetical protein